MSTKKVICSKCTHCRVRPKLQLFSLSEMQMSEVLKRDNERHLKDEERSLQEELRYKAKEPFNFEPHYYDWCDMFTPFDTQLFKGEVMRKAFASKNIDLVRKIAIESNQRGKEWIRLAQEGNLSVLENLQEHGSATFNPISGEVMQIYALCDRMNKDGECLLFEPKD